jgi:hypothetical protein
MVTLAGLVRWRGSPRSAVNAKATPRQMGGASQSDAGRGARDQDNPLIFFSISPFTVSLSIRTKKPPVSGERKNFSKALTF